jgi:hypothetical protein
MAAFFPNLIKKAWTAAYGSLFWSLLVPFVVYNFKFGWYVALRSLGFSPSCFW